RAHPTRGAARRGGITASGATSPGRSLFRGFVISGNRNARLVAVRKCHDILAAASAGGSGGPQDKPWRAQPLICRACKTSHLPGRRLSVASILFRKFLKKKVNRRPLNRK